MDDSIKIQALMVYYKHWGIEQNNIRKTLDGAQQFQKIYNENEFMLRMSCRSYLKRHRRRTLYHIIDILLKQYGGGFQPMDMLKPKCANRIELLMANSNIDGFNETNALSVDAIISLM